MTRTQAIAEIKALGLSARSTGYGGEIRVSFPGKGQEASAYYTDSPADAVDTARVMLASSQQPADLPLFYMGGDGAMRQLPAHLRHLEACARRWEAEPGGSSEAARVRAKIGELRQRAGVQEGGQLQN